MVFDLFTLKLNKHVPHCLVPWHVLLRPGWERRDLREPFDAECFGSAISADFVLLMLEPVRTC